MSDLDDIAQNIIQLALKAGADHADAVVATSESFSYGQRLGRVEVMEKSEARQLGLRAIVGGAQAIVSSNDMGKETLEDLAIRAVQMARIVPVDKDSLPADKNDVMKDYPENDELQLYDNEDVTMEMLIENAKQAEETALSVEGVSNSEGAHASASKSKTVLAISNGFCAYNQRTTFGVSASMIAGEGDKMQTDYAYSTATHWQNLSDAEKIGKKAAMRAIRKMGARQAESMQAPVVFSPRVGRSLLGYLLSAINGDAICKGTSFLKEKMGQELFNPDIQIIEDPHMINGLGSRFFDGEGLATVKNHWIENGVLTGWILDLRTARKLNKQSTGNARRGISSPPSPGISNAYIAPSKISETDLLADIKQGFYVTQTMGMGFNGVTGDYSQGAEGFWIENGKLTYPVQEMTIAGNLLAMYQNLSVADDLIFEQAINVPTIKISEMTVAGA